MATERLQVILQLAAGQYKREAREAAKATGSVAGAAKSAGTETSKLDRQIGATGVTMRTAVGVGAAVAGAAVLGFAKDSVQAATDLDESINAVRVTFGDAADDVLAIGENAANSFGLANSEFNSFAVQFSSFASRIATGSGRQVDAVIGELTGRIADFASVMNLDVPEAAEKFQSGLAGQTEPLRAFGIDVSANAVNQKALALGLAETTAELTEGDKVLARYELIMEQTDKTSGDFKNTQDGLANSTRTLSANVKDLQARLGQELTPVLADTANKGLQLLDVLDPDVDLGWTQRLSAGLQLVLGESTESVEAYIKQKTALFELSEEAEAAIAVTEESIGASNRHRGAIEETSDAAEDAVEATDGLKTSTAALAFQSERAGRAAQFQREQILKTRDELRNIHDPLFRVVSLNADLAAAQEAVAEASEDASSPEFRDAVIARAEVIADLEQTLIELKDQGIDPTGAAARLMLEGLGVPDNVINDMFAQFDALQSNFESRTFRATLSFPTVDFGDDGVAVRVGSRIFRQHGGPVSAARPYIVGERGPELFIPNSSGQVISNADITRLIAGIGGREVNYNIPIQSSGNQNADAQLVGAVASVLRRMETL